MQDRELRRNIWATSVYDAAIPQPRALGGAHIGFVGFGHIGRRAWNLFRAFGCTGAEVTGSGRVADVGRGPLVHERALYDALAGGVIRAAAIDVWYRYPAGDDVSPPADLPFAELPNLLMTPHSSGVTRDTFTGRVDDVVANIGRLKRGEPLRNVVHGG
jgi:phosphoglycerate dehydrogenase-like enzyme